MGDLVVELDGTPVGRLVGDWRTFDFHATSEGVQRFGLGASIISLAFPLTIRRVRSGKAARQAFFQGLLPEGRMLEAMAAEARVPVHDTIGLLRRYGRDVAGALQIWDPDVPGEPRAPRREEISETAVAEMLRDTRAQPIGNAPHGGKTSLAGVQDKIVLAEVASSAEGRRWARVLDGYASTHILKPQNPEVPEAIFDEEYGTRLLRAAGLSPFAAEIQDFAGVPALVIERYDRIPGDPPGRLHQEDMAQVLGVVGDAKYQRFGGAASLERSAVAVQKHCEEDSLTRLYAMTVAAVAVGNLDMHAKNISVLHPESVAPTLAPAYDVLPRRTGPLTVSWRSLSTASIAMPTSRSTIWSPKGTRGVSAVRARSPRRRWRLCATLCVGRLPRMAPPRSCAATSAASSLTCSRGGRSVCQRLVGGERQVPRPRPVVLRAVAD